jgi:hypothetical protein
MLPRIASFGHIGSYLFFQTSFTGFTMFHVVGDSSLCSIPSIVGREGVATPRQHFTSWS